MFAEGPAAKGSQKKPALAAKKGEPAKPAAPTLAPPRLVKTAKPAAPPITAVAQPAAEDLSQEAPPHTEDLVETPEPVVHAADSAWVVEEPPAVAPQVEAPATPIAAAPPMR